MARSRLPSALIDCFTFDDTARQGIDFAENILRDHGYSPERGEAYVYGAGDTPALLVAHVDTVHRRTPVAKELCFDPAKQILWSPVGLGADDRAGVYAIREVLASGRRPHVLFTDDEETGGRGAEEAAYSLSAPDVRCMVEIDRQGHNDYVMYDNDSDAMRRWCESFGWVESVGSFTDISVLMEPWNLSGANVSCGYYGQHTTGEYLRLDQLRETIRRVCLMVDSPPRRRLKYIETQKWANLTTWPPVPRRDREKEEDERRKADWEREYRDMLREHRGRDSQSCVDPFTDTELEIS